jgi:hypothetical protein
MELDNLKEEDAWGRLNSLRHDRKKEPNTIFKELESRKAERINQEIANLLQEFPRRHFISACLVKENIVNLLTLEIK